MEVDFAGWEDVRDAAASDVAANGPVAILVNNTGGPGAGPLQEADPEALAAAFEQHILTNQALVQAVQPGMIEMGYGRIINIISTSVVTPIRGLGVSNTIRAAVANWARTLAAELGRYGITVNVTCSTGFQGLLTWRGSSAGGSPIQLYEGGYLLGLVPENRCHWLCVISYLEIRNGSRTIS